MAILINNKTSKAGKVPSFANGSSPASASDSNWIASATRSGSGAAQSYYGTDNTTYSTSWAYAGSGCGNTTSSGSASSYIQLTNNLYKVNVDFRIYMVATFTFGTSTPTSWSASCGLDYWNGTTWVSMVSISSPTHPGWYPGSLSNYFDKNNCRIIWISDTQFRFYTQGVLYGTYTVSSTVKQMYIRVTASSGGGNRTNMSAGAYAYLGALTATTHALRMGRVTAP